MQRCGGARSWLAKCSRISLAAPPPKSPPKELKASLVLFSSLLDEQQRRLFAGLESLKYGRGGDQKLAALLQLDPHTVARGRQELLTQEVEFERVRKPGGRRKPTKKNARSDR